MANWQFASVLGQGLCVAALVWAAMHDLAVRTVPNRVVLAAGAGAFMHAITRPEALPGPLRAAAWACLAACAVLILACAFWRLGWIGGGDAKLLAAASPLVVPAHLPDLLLGVAVSGGMLALPYLPGRRLFARPPGPRPRALAWRLVRCERWRLSRGGPLPYAAAIAMGVVLVSLERN